MQRNIMRIGEYEIDAEPFVCGDGRFTARSHIHRWTDGQRATSREFPALDEFATYDEAVAAGIAAGREIVRELQAGATDESG